jgi:hypothetical protein
VAVKLPWSRRPAPATAAAGAARAHLERLSGLSLLGWAWSPEGALPELRVNGQPVEAAVVWFEREDVRQALGVSELRLGFEIELPAAVWPLADAQGRCTLEVWVAGVRAGGESPVLARSVLAGVLDECRHTVARLEAAQAAARAADLPLPPGPDAAEQFRLLQVLEHLAAVGGLSSLPPGLAEFGRREVQRYGLTRLFETDRHTLEAPAGPIAHDVGEVTVWQSLREFNAALPDDPAAAADVAPQRLSELLAQPGLEGELRQRLLRSLLPYFCGIGRYDALRGWLDAAALRRLAANGTSSWELSLALPELVAGGDIEAAGALLRRLAQAPGWLNAECVGEAVRQWIRQGLPRGPEPDAPGLTAHQPSQTQGLAMGLLALVEAQGDSAWGRVQDEHLTGAVVALVAHRTALTPAEQAALERTVLRHLACAPSFWNALSARQPERARWPEVLQAQAARLTRLQQRLDQAGPWTVDDALRHVALVALPAAAGSQDAARITRELLLQAVADAPDAAQREAALGALAAIDTAEPLRLLAHPLADARWFEAAGDVAAQLRRIDGLYTPQGHAVWSTVQRQLERGQAPAAADLRSLGGLDHLCIGARLAAQAWCVQRGQPGDEHRLALVHELWMRGWRKTESHAVPPAALLGAWHLLRQAQAERPDPMLGRLSDELATCLRGRWAAATRASLAAPEAVQRTVPGGLLVAVYACRANLETRVRQIRDTWARDLDAHGVPWVVVVGDDDAVAAGQLDGDLLRLPVGDAYEDLPAKTLALLRWTVQHTDAEHLLKIDDDCHLAVERFLECRSYQAHHYLGRRLHRGPGGTDRLWHQDRSASRLAAGAVDKSPEPSVYADGGSGYVLSRAAMARVGELLQTDAGARLTRSAFMEDKLLGDLLALGGFSLSSQGHQALVRRRFGRDPVPVGAFQNLFLPGPSSPVTISHLDDAQALPAVQAGLSDPRLRPGRLWSSWQAPSLARDDSNQLELLSPPDAVRALQDAPVIVVAVARNEGLLLPHFLAHYRGLGVRHFVLVDNLSDDGSRAWLLQQPDVVLYSADTPYRASHYGVAWQQAVLAAHALGRWAVLADIDEFLVYPGCHRVNLPDWLAGQQARGHEALTTQMVDMYPAGPLEGADLSRQAPFEAAPHFDRQPLLRWRLGSGLYSNAPTWLSGLRHRLIPDSAPNLYTSQKVAVMRYQPWVRLSEGLHYVSNLAVAPQPIAFAHFKYHAGFARKVAEEVARKQHFNGAEEYRKYQAMVAEAGRPLADPAGPHTAGTPQALADWVDGWHAGGGR